MPNKKSKVKTQKSKMQVKTKKLAKKAVVKKVVAKSPAPTSPSLRGASKITVTKTTKGASLNASVFDTKGKIAGHIELPSEIFGAKINDSLMSQAVRVYLANQRQGTVKTKDRGEVNKTTKKVWQQKGTGRARHGSKRAPIFVGGGLAFGPRPRDFSLNISKKMKTLALFSALSAKLKDSEIRIIKGLETIEPKTKLMAEVLKNLEVKKTSKVLLVMPKVGKELENVYRASRNIEGVEILSANSLNTYKVLDNKLVLLMKDSIDSLKNTFIKHQL
jgi:large subunit ribosomal protein L4